eukprot:CAMPEP_0171930774 /NCGR_PEP_ID=MMETSP0993-20121228/28922_1 /TAXON_ID=483369 /ORGANISM="non described non described, Strain CCMP2098" /LENGTH=93 /DNA_ID=CAMNT_0012570683 /DNA_START=339 /DNA_END=617 /DNA_ORIENTATION=+
MTARARNCKICLQFILNQCSLYDGLLQPWNRGVELLKSNLLLFKLSPHRSPQLLHDAKLQLLEVYFGCDLCNANQAQYAEQAWAHFPLKPLGN